MAWPPVLDDVKDDLKSDGTVWDAERDSILQRCLDAAVAFVTRVRAGDFNFSADPESTLPAPSADLSLGTIRLTGRLYKRRESPDGLVAMSDLGSARIPSVDPDIDRLLGIGRNRKGLFA